MKKVLAVALLDGRRLGFGIASAALVGGLIPSLANGLGAPVPAASVLAFTFLLVGAACGGYFGNDFAEGRSSFFFARPLPTWALIAGRVAALVVLTGVAFVGFIASNWLSTRDQGEWTFWVLDTRHLRVVIVAWAASLFVSLAIAARARDTRSHKGFREFVLIPLRLGAMLGAFLLMFGLFADLIVRAYSYTFRPMELFLWSWLAACLIASLVAIANGRTERLRIARAQTLVMGIHFGLVSMVVVAAWFYVLHPDVNAIRAFHAGWGSPDGRTAFVSAAVDRGDEKSFRPIFVVDLTSDRARLLNADRHQGPWTSADGASVVWSEATPFFFRPLLRHLGGQTTYRVRNASGQTAPLPMPAKAPDYRSARDLSRLAGVIDWVLPAPDGDVFAVLWDRHLTFTSRTRGDLSEIALGADRWRVHGSAVFMASGALRTAIQRRDASGDQTLRFVDIDPRSGAITDVASVKVDGGGWVRLERTGARALLISSTVARKGAVISLFRLEGTAAGTATTVLKDILLPSAEFMSDGRIVALGTPMGRWNQTSVAIVSADGKVLMASPSEPRTLARLGGEIFPGVVAVVGGDTGTTLLDLTTGRVTREIPHLLHIGSSIHPPPPGSAAARLLISNDGKLYELPALNAEPRLVPLVDLK